MNLKQALAHGRSAQLEFITEPDGANLARTIAAMANSAGGTLVLGMNAAGQPQPDALEWAEAALERALRYFEPPLSAQQLPIWQSEETPQGPVIFLTVKAAGRGVTLAGNELLVRSGSANIPRPHEFDSPAREPALDIYEETEVSGATAADFDEGILAEFERHRQQRGARGEVLTRAELLRDAGAVTTTGAPTLAGLLLFGRAPERFLPQAGLLIVRFRGTSLREAASSGERYLRRVEINGPAARQIERAWEVLREETQLSPLVEGLVRREAQAYPPEAVREAVVNAVCHRDYSVRGQRIEIRLFDDRLEIMSPGGLPGHITLDNILEEHYSRNPRLVRGLYYWGYIEELGQGIDIIYDAMQRGHHPAPQLQDTRRNFTVTLYNAVDDLEAEYGDELNQRQISVLKYLRDNERITNADFRRICPEVGAETLRLDLHELVEKGFLLRVGDKRG
ncbi:MAG: ATP-binding protein, partial [Anaerolineae bacterium]